MYQLEKVLKKINSKIKVKRVTWKHKVCVITNQRDLMRVPIPFSSQQHLPKNSIQHFVGSACLPENFVANRQNTAYCNNEHVNMEFTRKSVQSRSQCALESSILILLCMLTTANQSANNPFKLVSGVLQDIFSFPENISSNSVARFQISILMLLCMLTTAKQWVAKDH